MMGNRIVIHEDSEKLKSGDWSRIRKIVRGIDRLQEIVFTGTEVCMNKKSMWRQIVPILTVLTLVVSTACPVQAVDSTAEISSESPEQVIIDEEADLIFENAADAEEVLIDDPNSIIENASETEIVPAEDPAMIINDTSDAESSVVEVPDLIADNSLKDNQETQPVGGSDGSGTVEDPTVLAGEEAAYYDDPNKVGVQWTKGPFSPFPDIQDARDAYYQAICWAGNNGIAKGYSDGTFRSGANCTRGAAMMFLWRTMGKPAPKYVRKSPFPDVPMTHAFYKAILWAYQNGITKGYADGTFGINKNCTRGHAMMFLWRVAGKPDIKVTTVSPFKDISASHPYYEAVCWGSSAGVTKGFSDGTFGTSLFCTRGQIMTFLYRHYLNNFYTVTKQNGKIVNISSPVVKKKNGSYATILTEDRTTISVPTVPGKTLFIGNSLLQGLGSAEKGGRFGMCATDSRHDYYYYVTSAILKKNPTAVFTKLSGTAFEGSTDLDTAGRWYAAKRYLFKEDLDLIIIQLGDNVNDNEKQAAFGNNIRHLLAQIKADCPKARVICVGTWYYRPTVISDYIRACKENGCDFVSIQNLLSTQTLPPAGTIVTYNDGTTQIAEGGSLIHPNNYGMELIAKRIVAQLKLG